MLATSRKNRTRPPLAETAMFSLALEPLNASRRCRPGPRRCRCRHRVPLEGVVAGPQQGHVVALLAVDEVVAVAAEQHVGAVAAEDRVVACTAVDGDRDQGGQVAGRGEAVVAAVRVDDQLLGGADVERERRRVDAVEPDPGAVGGGGECSAPLPPLTSTVSVPAPPSLRSVSSPGFHTIRSSPVWPNAWSSPSPPVKVSLPAPPNRRSPPPLPRRMSLPACPKSLSSPEPPVSVSFPAPPNRFAPGSAPFASLRRDRVVAGLTEDLDQAWCSRPSGVPPVTATAPPFTRILPAASRLTRSSCPRVPEDGEHTSTERRCRRRARGRARRHDRSGTEHDTPKQPTRRTAPIAVTCFLHRLGVAHDDPFKSGRCP